MMVAGLVVAVLLILGATSGGILALRPDGAWSVLAASLIVTGLVVPGVMAGVTVSTWAADPRTADGRHWFVRLVLWVVGVQAASAVGLVVYAVATGLPAGVVVVVTLAALALTAACVTAGEWLRRRSGMAAPSASFEGAFTPAEVAAKIRRILITFVVAFVVVFAVIMLLSALFDDEEPEGWWFPAGGALSIALLAASTACLVVSWGLTRRIRAGQAENMTEQRTIGKAVLKNRDDDLPEHLRTPAARHAALMAAFLPFQLAQFALLYAGLVTQQLVAAPGRSGGLAALGMAIVVLLGLAAVVFFPLMVRQWRRVRAYAARTAHLLVPVEP
jgi:hypothetical protein